jgi:hypothetical protein
MPALCGASARSHSSLGSGAGTLEHQESFFSDLITGKVPVPECQCFARALTRTGSVLQKSAIPARSDHGQCSPQWA